MIRPCPFDQLPVDKAGPPYNAWGIWGPDDELGRLNLIDEAAVKRGRDEIKHGLAINLNMPMTHRPLGKDRILFEREVREGMTGSLVRDTPGDWYSNDDIVHFNTQSSTQWDGFRHFAYADFPKGSGQRAFYQGMTKAQSCDPAYEPYGIHNYAEHPITSRGVLLDIPLYLRRHPEAKQEYFPNGIAYHDFSTPFGLELLDAVVHDQRVEFFPGDVLLLRTGFTESYEQLCANTTVEEHLTWRHRHNAGHLGLQASEEVFRWHWDRGIAAVVGDNPAYEAFTCRPGEALTCHEVFLAGWGMPIGELFDLRRLAAECERLGRWSFMFTSMPLNIRGGIASPPNAQAIL